MRFAFLVPAAALLLAGCGSEELSCSASSVLETVGNIARKEIAKNPMGAAFDMDRTSFRIEDIRKQNANANSISCAANLYSRMAPVEAAKQSFTKEMIDQLASQAIDITYTVEKLDKGGFYVTVRGL